MAVLGEIVRAVCSKRRSGTDLARVFEAVGKSGGWVRRQPCRQAGNGRARNRAKATLLGGVVVDGPAVGRVLAERELQGADHCRTPLSVAIFWSGRCICVGYCSEQSAFGASNNAKST
jgi:hypothetical protein